MTRREWARRVLLGAGAGVLGVRPLRSQADTTRRAGDPLYDPRMVQERATATADDNAPDVKALEHRLKCTCGCNLDIYTCRTTDFTCSYSPQLHREVLELRQAGKTPDEIVAAFVEKYGERMLMAPEPRGFNLAGYLVPGILVAAAGVALSVVLLRRHRRLLPAAAPAPLASPAASADEERLRRALAEVED